MNMKYVLGIIGLGLGIITIMWLTSHKKNIEVQGHRGARAVRPENTLPSFEAAIKAGADVLEADILVTSDKVLVIHHDFYLNSELCTNMDGSALSQKALIYDLTLDQVKQLDCGRKANAEFPRQMAIPGTPIPTLQELFDWIRNSSDPAVKQIQLNLEIKIDSLFPERTLSAPEFAERILTQVKENSFSERVYYSSFDPQVLLEIRKLDPQARLGFIFDTRSCAVTGAADLKIALDLLIQAASAMQAEILSPDHVLLTHQTDLQIFKEKGFRVVPWTVNDTKRWRELVEMGVDGIITDDPQALVQFLKKEKNLYADCSNH